MNPYATGMSDPNYLGMYADPMMTGHSVQGFPDYSAAYASAISSSNQEYQQTQSVMTDGGNHFPVVSTAFDNHEELLWSGNQGGHVTSYYGVHLQKYTSFQVHNTDEVRALLPLNSPTGCILALMPNTLRCQLKRGVPVFTHVSKSTQDMCSMLMSPRETVVIGGHTDKLVDFDPAYGKELRISTMKEQHSGGCPILRSHPRMICSGNSRGGVRLHDPNSLDVINVIECHSGTLSDVDVQGDTVVTVGYHTNTYGTMSVDKFVKVYDVRMMKVLPPAPVVVDQPVLIRFLPSYSSRLLVMSSTGQAQIIDPSHQKTESSSHLQLSRMLFSLCSENICSTPGMSQEVNISPGSVVETLSISPSCQCFAVGTSDGYLHLSITNDGAVFHTHPEETEFGIYPYPTPVAPIAYNDFLQSLAAVPFPIPMRTYEEDISHLRPMSAWPENTANKIYRRTPPIDPDIVKAMKIVQSIGHYLNTGANYRARQIPYKLKETPTQRGVRHSGRRPEGAEGDSGNTDSEQKPLVDVPKRYRKTEVKYTKLGYEEFDFSRFNQTAFCGLESMLPNAYCNAMLHVLYFVSPLRGALLAHVCEREFCLACELGFLFHMLDQSGEFPCQPANFLRAFRTLPEAQALSLILNDQDQGARKNANLKLLVQNWNRFVLQQIHAEVKEWNKRGVSFMDTVKRSLDPEENVAEEKRERSEEKATEETESKGGQGDDGVSELSELFGTKNLESPPERVTFHQVLEKSLNFDQTNSCWCETCHKYRPTKMTRRFESIPFVFAMNCGLTTDDDVEFFKEQLELLKENQDAKHAAESARGVSKPIACRFGINCNRPMCRYSHDNPASVTGTFTGGVAGFTGGTSTSWIPEYFIVRWMKDGRVEILPLDAKELPKTMKNLREESAKKEANETPKAGGEVDANDPEISGVKEAIVYALSSVVSHVSDPAHPDKNNLVAAINVGPTYHQRMVGSPVNHITPISKEEATWFDPKWKLPAVLYFSRLTGDDALMQRIERMEKLSFPDLSVEVLRSRSLVPRPLSNDTNTFLPVQPDENFKKGDVVAIDAEFVTLNQEDMELRSDGTKATLKPSLLSVARISVLRGSGPMNGVPFIDDYISTQSCQVVDYLTKFSGIMPGDLDANFSSKHLTTLKNAYLKLRYLADLGVIFLGHGLKNDFRVINLVVKPEQLVDTVIIYRLPHQRMVSLRFLAWFFLKRKIQSFNHDSIEDARAALDLHRHYEKLVSEGDIDSMLRNLYAVGRERNWKVPGVDND
ncbi:unnamed protein product [Notodromas monacha]|uniref:USP domain-containing protein n=1 Tax=Notodromas monacha TaxID=399045 RepID=A0A7R9BG09_9CRUS|nr:unnamed protein product [Notodromas monacha]CAG0913799.1 unnamed protein product [Notodromas monacha]